MVLVVGVKNQGLLSAFVVGIGCAVVEAGVVLVVSDVGKE